MANDTVITVIGNLTADPELRIINTGQQVVNFTIASTPSRFDRATNQWVEDSPLFMRCSAWADLASHIAASLTKGMRVLAQGRLVQRSYTTQTGENRQIVELRVDDIGPSLRYATAQVTRIGRGQGTTSGQVSGATNNAPTGYSGGAPVANVNANTNNASSHGGDSWAAGYNDFGPGSAPDPFEQGDADPDEPAF